MAMNPRTLRRLERIREEVDITAFLEDLGYGVRAGMDREQQFSCDLHGSGQDTKPSARVYPESNSWYCVFKGVRTLTGDGWRPLGDTQSCPPTMDGDGVFRVPLKYLDRGTRACITVQTKAGYQVTLTSDHEVDTQNRGWVPAGDIKPGDCLIVPKPETPSFNKSNKLPKSTRPLNAQTYKGQPPLNLPSTWSMELGEALGYVFGDGWVTPRPKGSSGVVGITSSAEDAEDARKIFGVMRGWANGRGSEVHRTGLVKTPNGKVYTEDQYIFTIGNDGFCEWFRQMGLSKEGKPQDRRLPETLWSSPREGIVGFLRGMYATDGSIFCPKGRNGVRVVLYSVSGGFLRDVQLLLLQLGMHSRLYPNASTRPDGVWYLQLATGRDVLTFRSRVGFANARKQALLDSYVYNPRGSRPFKALVEKVTPAGDLPVADLSMPGSPTFVAGGIKVHNCFGCGATRDAVQTIREIKGFKLGEALKWVEDKYNLPALPFDPSEWQRPEDANDIVRASLRHDRTFDDDAKAMHATLTAITTDRDLSRARTLAFWEAYDKILHLVRGKRATVSEERGRVALEQLRQRVMEEFASP